MVISILSFRQFNLMTNSKTLIIICLIIASCSESNKVKEQSILNELISVKDIKNTTVDISLLDYHRNTSVWKLNGELYSGYAISKFENDTLKQKFGILNGKKQNKDLNWFPSGKLKSEANYHKGKLHGEKKIWIEYPSYSLIAQYNYYFGKGHGKQVKWYSTGEIFQILNLDKGREEGMQQAFRKNGALYANYEAKNGRIFGLKKAALCFGLEKQKISNND